MACLNDHSDGKKKNKGLLQQYTQQGTTQPDHWLDAALHLKPTYTITDQHAVLHPCALEKKCLFAFAPN